MVYEVRWADRALQQVVAIAEYVHERSPQNAESLAIEIIHSALGLSEYPERHRVIDERFSPPLRQYVVHHCLVWYQVHDSLVEVVGVVEGRRDLDAALREIAREQE